MPVSPAAKDPAAEEFEFEKKVGEELSVRIDPLIPLRVCEIVKLDKARLLIFFALIVNTTTSEALTVLSESVTISE